MNKSTPIWTPDDISREVLMALERYGWSKSAAFIAKKVGPVLYIKYSDFDRNTGFASIKAVRELLPPSHVAKIISSHKRRVAKRKRHMTEMRQALCLSLLRPCIATGRILNRDDSDPQIERGRILMELI